MKRASFPLRLFGTIFKPFFFRREIEFRRNSNTAPELLVDNEVASDFEYERRRLLASIETFIARGPQGCSTDVHAFFGHLTPDEWGALIYKHLDHHLRQFAA